MDEGRSVPPADGGAKRAGEGSSGAGGRARTAVAFGGYTLLQTIAEGGMGVVVEAVHAALGRRVAIKLLNRSYLDRMSGPDQNVVAAFLGEARILSALDHPHIVPVYDAGMVGSLPYYAMKLVRGDLDADVAAGGPWPTEQVLALGAALGSACAHMAAAGLVNRDIKPANILLEAGRRPRLADFGLAMRMDEAAPRGTTIVGTPSFVSPEQARNETLDRRSDIFSVGAVMRFAATGDRWVSGASPMDVFAAVAGARVPPAMPGIDPDLAAVIGKAMHPDRDARHADGAELEADCLAILRGGRPKTALVRRSSSIIAKATGFFAPVGR